MRTMMGRTTRRHRSLLFIPVVLGMMTAWVLATSVLPRMAIHADSDGVWQYLDVDWNYRMVELSAIE